ncbi:hypothetical protein P389DRAFT_177469 [Cystobasidium minutum MCA 4210]|uniref:uncharacterized protein n=1 Tax=Cystobasidium minutum MCA 4210 TaxID=1397322 RepID=UPI0034CFE698|eukprot:jgi/Rhomi1/177469/fgenesh1_pg.1_\
MDIEDSHPSRPLSSLSHVSFAVNSSNGLPDATTSADSTLLQTTLTPRNVKQWADYQASFALSGEDRHESPEGIPAQATPDLASHFDTAYPASHGLHAGLGIGHSTTAYTHLPPYNDQVGMQAVQIVSRPTSSLDVHAFQQSSNLGLSPSANELSSPLTWSPAFGHADANSHSAGPAHPTPPPPTLSIDTSHTVLYSPTHEGGDDEATLKRYSFNPMSHNNQLGISGLRSATSSPVPPASSSHWRRPPLPFGSDQATTAQATSYNTSGQFNTAQPPSDLSSLLTQSMPSTSGETAGTPQVTLSPAFQDESSSRPWSPGDYLVYNGTPSQTPLPSSTANSACSSSYGSQPRSMPQRSVSPQNSLLAPHPIYTHRTTFPVIGCLSPDQYSSPHAFAHGYPEQQRQYSTSPQMSASSLSAFRVQHQPYLHLYRDPQYSPLGSSVGSYHSESADEGDNGSGASSSGAARSPSSNLAFSPAPATGPASAGLSAGSPYTSHQLFFSALQLGADHLVGRPSSSLSNYSSASPHLAPRYTASYDPAASPGVPQPTLHRSVSLNAPRRPSAVRYLSHPYQSVYDQYVRPQSVQGRREDAYVGPAISPAWRSTPDLVIETDQHGSSSWILPSEEDVKRAAMQYGSPSLGTGHGSGPQQLREANDAGQKTVTARQATSSTPRSSISTLFSGDSADIDVPSSESFVQSTSATHPTSSSKGYALPTVSLLSLDKLPASGKVTQGKHGASLRLLGQTLLPLHMLPTKRSRGRRPVISPELDIAPTVESTTASTLDQVSFTGVTKTGKPKKIFHQKNIHTGWTPPAGPGGDHEDKDDGGSSSLQLSPSESPAVI